MCIPAPSNRSPKEGGFVTCFTLPLTRPTDSVLGRRVAGHSNAPGAQELGHSMGFAAECRGQV